MYAVTLIVRCISAAPLSPLAIMIYNDCHHSEPTREQGSLPGWFQLDVNILFSLLIGQRSRRHNRHFIENPRA